MACQQQRKCCTTAAAVVAEDSAGRHNMATSAADAATAMLLPKQASCGIDMVPKTLHTDAATCTQAVAAGAATGKLVYNAALAQQMLAEKSQAAFHAQSVLVVQRLLHAGSASELCLQHGRVLHCAWAAHVGRLSYEKPLAPAHAADALALLGQATGSSGSSSFWTLVGRNIIYDQLGRGSVGQKSADQCAVCAMPCHAQARGPSFYADIQQANTVVDSSARTIGCGWVDEIIREAKWLAAMTNRYGLGAACLPQT
jgi:hypothetical protein